MHSGNYRTWSQRFLGLLETKGLAAAIEAPTDGVVVTPADARKAKGYLRKHVGDEFIGPVSEAANVRAAWVWLEEHFRARSAARLMQLKTEFTDLKKTKSESVAAYVGRARALCIELTSIGEPVTNQSAVIAVLKGLPKQYEVVVKNMLSNVATHTLDTVLAPLMVDEK